MQNRTQQFTPRQYMVTRDFEYFHYRDRSTTEVDYHNHDFLEVYLLISGRVTYMIEGKSYRLKPWDILLVNNNELHRPIIEPGETYERIIIWINPDFAAANSTEGSDLSMCFGSPSHNRFRLFRPDSDILGTIKNTLSKFEEACNSSGFGSSTLKTVYLTELLVFLNRAYLDTGENILNSDIEYNEKISNIVLYINKNLNGDLSLEQLSSGFYISKYHLLREFKRHTGYTIHRFIQQKRLLLAKSLLKEGMQIAEICIKCGFRDYSNFIRAFKKTFGIPPKKYLKLNQR